MAELALAIAPLCIGGVKIGKLLIEHLSSTASYMTIVDEARTDLATQQATFLWEFKSIIGAAIKGSKHLVVDELLKNTSHDGWASEEFDERLARYFQDSTSLKSFKSLVVRISKSITDLSRRLDSFDEVNCQGQEGGNRLRRSSHSIKASFSESTYREEIQKLRVLVADLRQFRKLTKSKAAIFQGDKTQIPEEYHRRKEDARLFLKAMSTGWGCTEWDHTHHAAKLLLVNTLRGPATKSLGVIIHLTYHQESTSCTSPMQHLQFYVVPNTSIERVTRKAEVHILDGIPTPAPSQADENPTPSEKTTREELCEPMKEISRQWNTNCGRATGHEPLVEYSSGSHDISAYSESMHPFETQSLCSLLASRKACSCHNAKTSCPGFLKLYSDDKQFDFHAVREQTFPGRKLGDRAFQTRKHDSKLDTLGKLTNFADIFRRDIDECILLKEQLWLASLLVESALQYYDTPWWPHEAWSLDQLAFYERENEIDELVTSLQTLHLTTDLNRRRKRSRAIQTEVKEAMELHGIRNLTLWSVGVALLQIGLWKPISWMDAIEVRRSVGQLKMFNPQYYRLTYKLIHCDFSEGHDLREVALQEMVYHKVIRELEAISALF